MNNLDTWNKLKQPPTTALKSIGAGRLKGKSDINPQWRYQAMTEAFGMCGVGWKYEIVKVWTEAGANNTFAFAQVNLYVRVNNQPDGDALGSKWSDPIPALGGSMLIQKESAGLHDNDEAFKMATTDALGTAMKMLGVAADIYLGNYDGSKYTNQAEPVDENAISDKQIKMLMASLGDLGIKNKDDALAKINKILASNKLNKVITSSKQLLKEEASIVIDDLQSEINNSKKE